MKAAKLTLIVLITLGIIAWLRGGQDFHIAKVLPFCGGEKPQFYDFGALTLILLMFWGMGRLYRRLGDEDADSSSEEYELDDDQDVEEVGDEETDEDAADHDDGDDA